MPCENDTAQGADQEPAAAMAAGKGSIVFCSQNQQAVLCSYQKDCWKLLQKTRIFFLCKDNLNLGFQRQDNPFLEIEETGGWGRKYQIFSRGKISQGLHLPITGQFCSPLSPWRIPSLPLESCTQTEKKMCFRFFTPFKGYFFLWRFYRAAITNWTGGAEALMLRKGRVFLALSCRGCIFQVAGCVFRKRKRHSKK